MTIFDFGNIWSNSGSGTTTSSSLITTGETNERPFWLDGGTTASSDIIYVPELDSYGNGAQTTITHTYGSFSGNTLYYFANGTLKIVDNVLDKKTKLVNKIKNQLIEHVDKKWNHPIRALGAGASFEGTSESELTALNLLKKLVDPREWKRYLSYGFLMTRGPSNLRYQIVRKNHHVKVYSAFGKFLAELCANVSYKFNTPPTDNVITKKIMIETDELFFWKKANVYPKCAGFLPEKAFTKEFVEAMPN